MAGNNDGVVYFRMKSMFKQPLLSSHIEVWTLYFNSGLEKHIMAIMDWKNQLYGLCTPFDLHN